jgi:hypothetical protein
MSNDPRTWNYRLVKSNTGIIGIFEVYYDSEGNPRACTTHPAQVMGETVEEILRIVKNMEQAADKPVLPMALFEADRESAIARIMQLDEELEGS